MRRVLRVIGVLAVVAVLLSACSTNGTAPAGARAAGRLEIRVTDAPARPEVTGVWVTISEVKVHKATPTVSPTVSPSASPTESPSPSPTPEEDEDGWIDVGILQGMNRFNLFDVKDLEKVLAVGELAPGRYTQIRMTVTKVEVSLNDGELEEPEDWKVPSGNLKFVHPFDIKANETTALLFDFDAAKSVNITGQGKVIVKPVVKLSIEKNQGQDTTTVEGTITGVDQALKTVTIMPGGQTEAITLGVNPQTQITLNDAPATLADIAVLGTGNTVTASYYVEGKKAINIDAHSPPV